MSDVILSEMEKRGKIGCAGMRQPTRKYNIAKRNIQVGTAQIPMGNNVNGFTVKNSGNTIVIFNHEPLMPGESETVGGNEGEEYVGRVDIFFQPSVPVVVPTINSCWIVIKFYVE
jgi:hypothetical protein